MRAPWLSLLLAKVGPEWSQCVVKPHQTTFIEIQTTNPQHFTIDDALRQAPNNGHRVTTKEAQANVNYWFKFDCLDSAM